jgi:CBS domain-containing protein
MSRRSPEDQEFEVMVESDEQKTLEAMTAADVMTAAPLTCSTFSTVLEAVMIFRDANCGAVPILEEGRPVAILTDRDAALALPDRPDLVSRPVSEIMKPGIVAVAPSDSLGHVCEVLRREAVRRVLVVDPAGRLLGIIGWADIAPVLSDRMMGRLVTENVVTP